jgi:hypothetical protein
VLADALGLAACWPLFVAWSATSKLALSTLAQVLVVDAGCWHCCSHCCHHGCECCPSNNCEEIELKVEI